MEKLSAKAAESSEEDDNILTFDSDDADLSYEVEEAKTSTSREISKVDSTQPSAETLTALTQTEKLIREISLSSSEQDHQEALHLAILLAAAKAEGIKAKGSLFHQLCYPIPFQPQRNFRMLLRTYRIVNLNWLTNLMKILLRRKTFELR